MNITKMPIRYSEIIYTFYIVIYTNNINHPRNGLSFVDINLHCVFLSLQVEAKEEACNYDI